MEDSNLNDHLRRFHHGTWEAVRRLIASQTGERREQEGDNPPHDINCSSDIHASFREFASDDRDERISEFRGHQAPRSWAIFDSTSGSERLSSSTCFSTPYSARVTW